MTKIENKEKIQQFLDEWIDGNATLWGYICSFQHLVLRIVKPGISGNLHLNCTACFSIKVGKVSWKNPHLRITEISTSKIPGAKYLIEDKDGEFEVICGRYYLERDVEPIY